MRLKHFRSECLCCGFGSARILFFGQTPPPEQGKHAKEKRGKHKRKFGREMVKYMQNREKLSQKGHMEG
jgi:hypothetical protein